MPKPTTREELLKETYDERARLDALIKTIPGDIFESKKVTGEWTAKDVISHLIAWEQMVILWVKSGYEGKSIPRSRRGIQMERASGVKR